MSDSDYIKAGERSSLPSHSPMNFAFIDLFMSHAVADDVMRELAEALREAGRLGFFMDVEIDDAEEVAAKQAVAAALARYDALTGGNDE
jgi:hypothetical protein